MKTKISDMKKGQEYLISGTFSKELKYKKEKKDEPWFHVTIINNNQRAYAKIWNNLELYPMIEEMTDGTFVEATVKCTEDSGWIHIEIKSIKIVEKKTGEYVDRHGLKNELRQAITSIKDEHLRKLLNALFARPDMKEAYFQAPATLQSGYSFEGGVLAYVVRSIRLVKSVSATFNEWNHNPDNVVAKLNQEFLITACILESIGRIKGLRLNGKRVEKTVEGEMFEESYLTMKVVLEEIQKLNFPDEQRMLLEHVVGSARGRLEWGALHHARAREAVALNIILNLNMQMGSFEYLERNTDDTDMFAQLNRKTMFLGSYE